MPIVHQSEETCRPEQQLTYSFKPPSPSVVKQNAAMLIVHEAPRMFCAAQKLHLTFRWQSGTSKSEGRHLIVESHSQDVAWKWVSKAVLSLHLHFIYNDNPVTCMHFLKLLYVYSDASLCNFTLSRFECMTSHETVIFADEYYQILGQYLFTKSMCCY